MEIRKAAGALGAFVTGIDLARASESARTVEDVRAALDRHEVLFFRDQPISPGQHLAFALRSRIEALGGRFVLARHWAEGGKDAENVARAVVEMAESGASHKYVYEDTDTLQAKITAIATKIYGAGQVTFADAVKKQLDEWNKDYSRFPVCMAKKQMSFSADANAKGAPSGHTLNVREVRLANGAGFVVAICGDMMIMPGLPKLPSAEKIDIDENGKVSGLF